ncbi:MAG: hypothetical protein ACOX4I_07860 [Anaerovoracaceae bacterium]
MLEGVKWFRVVDLRIDYCLLDDRKYIQDFIGDERTNVVGSVYMYKEMKYGFKDVPVPLGEGDVIIDAFCE